MSFYGSKDFTLEVAKGNVTGHSLIHKFGEAPDFDIGDGSVTIWDGASDTAVLDQMQYTYSATADIDSLTSSNDGDTVDIEIQGLDSSWNAVTQTITLTGQTRAALTTSLIRVYRLKNIGATDLAGIVYCFVNSAITAGVPDDLSKTRAVINAANNQSLMAIYTIPNAKTGYLCNFFAGTAGALKTSEHTIKLLIRPTGQVFQLNHISNLIGAGVSHWNHIYAAAKKFEAKTDIEIQSNTDTNVAAISAGFDLILVDD